MFVGRQRELGQLRAGLERSLRGRGALFLVTGEAGIGKSRLTEELAAEAQTRGAAVLWGLATQAEGAPPYWVWIQILRSLLRERGPAELKELAGPGLSFIARLVPELSGQFADVAVTSIADDLPRFATYDAVAQLLVTAASRMPIVVVLEDLHWADVPSLLLLQLLAGAITHSALMVMGTYRQAELPADHPLRTQLADYIRRGETIQIDLGGLSETDVARLLRAHTAYEPSEDLVRRVQRQTAGNPFFVKELARVLIDDTTRLPQESSGAVSPGVAGVLRRRMQRLSDDCQRMLEVAAVAGQEFDLDLVQAITNLAPERLLDLCDEALVNGLFVNRRGEFAFAHGLCRDTVYDGLTTSHRAHLHAVIAKALESRSRPGPERLSQLAHHFTQAAVVDSSLRPKAVAYATSAGKQAMTELAYEEAVGRFESALELAPAGAAAEKAELMLDLARASYLAGDVPRAIEIAHEVSRIGFQLNNDELIAQAPLVIRGIGGADVSQEMKQLCQRALGRSGLSPSLRVQLLSQMSVALATTTEPGDDEKAVEYSAEAMALAESELDPDVRFAALHARQMASAGPEGIEERLDLARRTLALARESGRRSLEQWGHDWRADALAQLGRIDEVETELNVLARLARQLHEPVLAWRTLRGQSWISLLRGRFDEARRRSAEARESGLKVLGADAEANYWLHAGMLAAFLGERDVEERPRDEFVQQHPTYALMIVAAMVPADVARGALDGARTLVGLVRANPGRGVRPRMLGLPVRAFSAMAIAAVGDAEMAAVAYQALLPYARLNVATGAGLTGLCGSVPRFLGMLAAAQGHFEKAAQHYEDAIEFETRMGAPPFVACSRILYAELLLREGRPDRLRQAKRLAAEGLSTADGLGMAPWIDRARKVLRDLDARKVEDHPLSQRELQVAALVAEGLSNHAIAQHLHLSERTAESHVKNICDKLGFNSRAQVAAWVARRKQT